MELCVVDCGRSWKEMLHSTDYWFRVWRKEWTHNSNKKSRASQKALFNRKIQSKLVIYSETPVGAKFLPYRIEVKDCALAGQVLQWNRFSCVGRQCEVWCICSCIRGVERLRNRTEWKARDTIEFYAWAEGDTCIPTAGMASANAGAPEASNAMFTAPATVTILFIIFWAGFGSVHDWTKPTLTRATTRRKKRPYIFKSDDKVRK